MITVTKDKLRQVAREIGVDETHRPTMQMIECGLHSGFPTCCVAFFVKIWWPYAVALSSMASVRAHADALAAYDGYSKWTTRPGYVACPRCVLEKRFVEVQDCDCEAKRLAAKKRRKR